MNLHHWVYFIMWWPWWLLSQLVGYCIICYLCVIYIFVLAHCWHNTMITINSHVFNSRPLFSDRWQLYFFTLLRLASILISGGTFGQCQHFFIFLLLLSGGGPRVVVSTAAFHARVRGSVPGLGGFKETKKCFFPIEVWKLVLWGASVTER